MRIRSSLVVLALVVSAGSVRAQDVLSVVTAQPSGELANLAQAAEIRVRFSEPMVPIGRLPEQVVAPFFTIRPTVAGTFRWAGPTLLVFTPAPQRPLPNATKYDVTIAATATAVSGRKLPRAYAFSFTTPTVRLLQTQWYRLNGRFDQSVLVVLRFNQPVRPADALAHTTARYARHTWAPPVLWPEQRARMGADGVARFEAKVAAVRATAAAQAPIPLRIAPDWDKKRFPPAANLVVLQTTTPASTDGWMAVTVDNRVPAIQGSATPPAPQSHTIELEPTFFVEAFYCRVQCDADTANLVQLRTPVRIDALRRAVTVRDITNRTQETPVNRPANPPETYRSREENLYAFTLEDVGFDRQAAARTYAVALDAGLQAADGQTLGYPWIGVVENWHDRAFTSFGDGHGVWEAGGGPLPFYARNFVDVWQWARAIAPDRLMPTILDLTKQRFATAPPGDGVHRALGGAADRMLSHGLDLSGALDRSGRGLVWAAVRNGQPIAQARPIRGAADTVASIVQVTNLGINVKDSPQNTLVFVTRLDTGAPVPGADVTIVRTDNSTAWRGRTDEHGIVLAPQTRLRDPRRPWKLAFVVTAEKDGDVAYVGSDWNEGVEPFAFGMPYDIGEAQPLLRGTVFADRGVYKLGEEIHFKAILRRDTPTGIQLIPSGTSAYIAVRDSRDKVVDRRTVSINAWSTTEWTMKLSADGALGTYEVLASLDKAALEDRAPAPRPSDDDEIEAEEEQPRRNIVRGDFLVAAYRRPEFRVDATLGGEVPIVTAGATLKGTIEARYLFGAPMATRPVSWNFSRSPVFSAPAAVLSRYPGDRFVFVGCCDKGQRPETGPVTSRTGSLDAKGQLSLALDTQPSDGLAYQYTLEGDVEDVSRQHIAGRASFLVHPAPWYIGLKRPSLFVAQKDGLSTAVVAVAPDGTPIAGVTVNVTLVEVQWNSVRRAEGNGFYTWEVERKEIDAGHFTVTTSSEPVPLAIPLKSGGSYLVRATAQEAGYKSSTRLPFYAIGTGYTAWARYDHNRIDIVPERESYKPGETARLMIQSPWERATALLTVEREGIRSHTQFTLTSTQQMVTVPIAAADIPNLFVSVLLVKGRTKADATEDTSDPGKPAFRLGYARLDVEDASKRLSTTVKANRDEYRPAGAAKVDVQVMDAQGAPAQSEVTLWAVDYGVLSLTGFRTPDVLSSVYVPKALEVMSEDNRQRIVSRRVLTPKGTDEGGGGGVDESVSQIRRDFRALAFWVGSVTTDSHGRASVDVKLPESLTTYRIMAVSGDKASRFGAGESEIRVNKPVVLKAAFPRFLSRGDKSFFGSVVTSQLKQPGTATITMKSLDPAILQIAGDGRQTVQVGAGASIEVRFDVAAKAVGRARVQTTVRLNGETDAFEDSVPVQVAVSPESVATYSEASPDARQTLEVPTGVVPGFGGVRLELSSTALVGLGEGARYVVEYPYGCVEQQASRAFVMTMASDLGDAFKLQDVDARDLRTRAQRSLRDLEKFQCPAGGFAFWPGECRSQSPYLTAYVLQVYQAASALKYDVDADVMKRAYDYLEKALAQPQPGNEGWWPAYTAWEALAVKVLTDGGRSQDSNINRLYGYLDRMPIFGLAYLYDAVVARHEVARPAELRRRIGNAMLPEAGSQHVEELTDPYLMWFWNSNIRSTAIVLNSLVRAGAASTDVSPMVRWLLAARRNGRWTNTQENAIAMQALVNYYRKYEAQVPNFTASVRLGTEDLVRASFKGRSATSTVKDVPLATIARTGASSRDLVVHKDGDGTLFFSARLAYAPDPTGLAARDNGFHVQRQYALMSNGRAAQPGTTFQAGDLVRVTLSFDLPKERRYVAVTDPLPAGFEPVDSWFATTAADLSGKSEDQDDAGETDWMDMWRRGTFDHVERHDDRVLLFATRLSDGHHEFSYMVRATTAGTFEVAPARVEEMYAPEVSGRTATQSVEVKR